MASIASSTDSMPQTEKSVTPNGGNNQNSQTSNSDASYLIKGWARFFTYIPNLDTQDKPSKFEFNQAFQDQLSRGAIKDDQTKDQFGYLNVPTDTHFFFVLTKKTLFAVSARRNDIAKTVKSLEVAWLDNIETDNAAPGLYKGGLEDIGNYKEGFCFRLKSKTKVVWNLCVDTQDQKKNWMDVLLKLLPHSDVTGANSGTSSLDALKSQMEPLPFSFGTTSPGLSEIGVKSSLIATTPGGKVDGRWLILQDWSQCTLACNGGKQYLQRMCVPPQNGGRPCSGSAILDRDCNKDPCPGIIQEKSEEFERPPMVKMHKISDRLQRFETCIVKEEDMDLVIERKGYERSPRFPARVVLNNRTLSVFVTASYDNIYMSFDLNYMKTSGSQEDPAACFMLTDQRDPTKHLQLCIMPLALQPSQSLSSARDKWINDIKMFSTGCKEKEKYVDAEDPVLQERKKGIQLEEQDNQMMRVKEKDEQETEKSIEKNVQETAKSAVAAMEKEMKYEQLAIQEEALREKADENAQQLSLQQAEEKKACFERDRKKKDQSIQLAANQQDATDKINRIKQTSQEQVSNSRADVYKKIENMRKNAERKRRASKRHIQEIRTTMATEVLNENRKGNISTCDPSQPEVAQKQYCNRLSDDDIEKKEECLNSPEDFCYTCCENEFGLNMVEDKNRCQKLCDDFSNKKGPQTQKPSGDTGVDTGSWVFVPKTNKV